MVTAESTSLGLHMLSGEEVATDTLTNTLDQYRWHRHNTMRHMAQADTTLQDYQVRGLCLKPVVTHLLGHSIYGESADLNFTAELFCRVWTDLLHRSC